MIQFNCPHCGKSLRTKAEAAGKRAKCPGCGEVVQVPKHRQDNTGESPNRPVSDADARSVPSGAGPNPTGTQLTGRQAARPATRARAETDKNQQVSLARKTIRYTCCWCGARIETDNGVPGKMEVCPTCGKANFVPEGSSLREFGAGVFLTVGGAIVCIGVILVCFDLAKFAKSERQREQYAQQLRQHRERLRQQARRADPLGRRLIAYAAQENDNLIEVADKRKRRGRIEDIVGMAGSRGVLILLGVWLFSIGYRWRSRIRKKARPPDALSTAPQDGITGVVKGPKLSEQDAKGLATKVYGEAHAKMLARPPATELSPDDWQGVVAQDGRWLFKLNDEVVVSFRLDGSDVRVGVSKNKGLAGQ